MPLDRHSGSPSDAEMARSLLKNDGEGLRIAYAAYIARAPWVPFERFEMGVQVIADTEDKDA